MVCELSVVLGSVSTVVGGLQVGRLDVAAELVEMVVVEPVDPLGGGDLDGVQGRRVTGVVGLHLQSPVSMTAIHDATSPFEPSEYTTEAVDGEPVHMGRSWKLVHGCIAARESMITGMR